MIDISQEELLLFLFRSFVSGAVLGAFYDVLRIVRIAVGVEAREKRRGFRVSRIFDLVLVFLLDVLFGVSVGVMSVLLIYHANEGIFRGMVYGGMLCGFLLYRVSVSKLIIKLAECVIRFVKKAVRKIIRIILIPIKALFRLIKMIYHLTIGRIVGKIVSEVKKARAERRERRMKKRSEQLPDAKAQEDSDRGDFVYVNEKKAYKKEGRISFCKRE